MRMLGNPSSSTPGVLICCLLHCQVVSRRAEAVFEVLHVIQCAFQHLLIALQRPLHAQKLALQTNDLVVHLSSAIKSLKLHVSIVVVSAWLRLAGQVERTHCSAAAFFVTQGFDSLLQSQPFLL